MASLRAVATSKHALQRAAPAQLGQRSRRCAASRGANRRATAGSDVGCPIFSRMRIDESAPHLGRVEEEALARGPERNDLPGGRRAQPFGRRGDERIPLVVVLGDLPDIEQRLLDQVAVGALEPEMRVDRPHDAVERRGDAAGSARAAAPSTRALVHVVAEPLGEPALADACFSVQEHELLSLGPAGGPPRRRCRAARPAPRCERPAGSAAAPKARARSPKTPRSRPGPISAARDRLFDRRDLLHDDRYSGVKRKAQVSVGVGGFSVPIRVRASPAYSKRCQGRLAMSVRTNTPHLGGHVARKDEIGERLVAVPVEDLFDRAGERLAPREQVVEDAADRVEIGRGTIVRRGPANLLGRHPTRRSGARAHHRGGAFVPVEPMIDRIAHQRREPEVEDEHPRDRCPDRGNRASGWWA